MNITLIRPPSYSIGFMGAQLVPYLGITYIAASARKVGHSIDIIDMCGEDIDRTEVFSNKYISYGMSIDRLNNRIKNKDIIGFTCMFSQDWPFHRKLISYVHSLFPDSLFVAGGEHITALPDFCLEDCPELDICVIGEADKVFVDLINAFELNEDFSEVSSLVYHKNGFNHTQRANRIENIDELSYPAWDLVPIENYLSRNLNYHVQRGRTIPMLATRGCPYQCEFCSNSNMWSKPWIHRNPKLIVEEMKLYIKKYNVKNFIFSDLSAVIDKKKIIELCNEIINNKIDITFQLPTLRTEVLDKELLKLMYHAGCRELDFAIESASDIVLKSINKQNDSKKMTLLIENALDTGFNLSANIVIGLPKENFKEFLKSFFLTIKLSVMGMQELNVFPFIPYPGSKLFNEYLKVEKIKLNDTFFLNLFSYADLGKAISFSENFGPRTLNCLRLVMLSSFYGIMFLTHPHRLFKLIKNAIQGKTSTKLENVLYRILKNIKYSHDGYISK